MKKNITARGIIVLAALFVAYLVVAFAVPFLRNGMFWMSFAFTVAAFAAQIFVFKISFQNGEEARSKFYGFPIARIGVVYLSIQLVLGLIMMGVAKWVPVWIAAVVYVIVLAASLVGFSAADVMRNEIERQDTVLKANVTVMRDLQSKSNALVGLCDAPALKEELTKLAEDFRFSDPVSKEALSEIETTLTACVDELQKAISDGETDSALALCRKAKTTLAERNRLCKLNK